MGTVQQEELCRRDKDALGET
ncbi:hypothetical protein CGLO_18278 [Colletotrichum gloeosporioides Cg-14]|uniref:Uncharacterized protein n=1 Tax=Colletotrichum gloeosporioides (strain Cg-14) TaxID=1237896 RepID=T0JIC1_COLGC|nr:hypothetical protein CGLO_18278 [Colletotrichum gloeosporioides Cg-14]